MLIANDAACQIPIDADICNTCLLPLTLGQTLTISLPGGLVKAEASYWWEVGVMGW